MPVDVNRAGYIRHTGHSAANQYMPRALLPMARAGNDVNLGALRDPTHPSDPHAHAAGSGQPTLLWMDVHIPPDARAGVYSANVDVMAAGGDQPLYTLPLKLNVYDFVLPDDRHLMMVGQIDWSDLTRLYPDCFEAISPRLMNRKEDRYQLAIRTLDELVKLAQENRTQFTISRLQPSVSWPAGSPPRLHWEDYDSLVTPWLKGDMFADKVPFGFWALPQEDHLQNYDRQSQLAYWAAAASHFDQLNWISRSAVIMDAKTRTGRADALEAVKISSDAAAILNSNQSVRVAVPLEDDQISFATQAAPGLVIPDSARRLITANPGLVFTSPLQNWPDGVPRPHRWMRTDLTGLIPYIGAGGDERDVRLWSWLATIPLPPPKMGDQYGAIQFVRWNGALPRTNSPGEAADPSDLVWFYPGSWFGVDGPVPTVQLKWLRRAQQDYEYIFLARQRGDSINPLLMARLMTKPVQLAADQPADPTFGLMCGTADPKAWTEAIELLAQRILLKDPARTSSSSAAALAQRNKEGELNTRTLEWGYPQERPVLMGRSAQWIYQAPANNTGPASVDLKLGIDIYNASDRTPDQNALQWTDGPAGWHWHPQATPVPQLATYHVQRFNMDAHVEPSEVESMKRSQEDLTFTDGLTRTTSKLPMVLPVAISERREGRLVIDGKLNDWMPEDAIQLGELTCMFNRPSLQAHQLQKASTPSQIYTGWADENFYVAFKVSGISRAENQLAQNWVSYQFRRAWGEDLCQVLICAVYADNKSGPLLHVTLKPNASTWIERKLDERTNADPWQTLEGTGIRYSRTLEGQDWRGEVAIPWKAINDPNRKDRPVMLRFNFSQHKTATGESSSWAGPVDFGRDDALMGLLFLRESNNPGMAGN